MTILVTLIHTIEETLRDSIHRPCALANWYAKEKLDPTNYHPINWKALNRASRSAPRPLLTSLTKLYADLSPTNSAMAEWGYTKSPQCHLCGADQETVDHVL